MSAFDGLNRRLPFKIIGEIRVRGDLFGIVHRGIRFRNHIGHMGPVEIYPDEKGIFAFLLKIIDYFHGLCHQKRRPAMLHRNVILCGNRYYVVVDLRRKGNTQAITVLFIVS